MHKLKSISAVIWITLVIASFSSAQTPSSPTAADNTKTNKTAGPTADQQNQSKTDVQITRDIRQLLTKDKELSTYAKNIKVVSQNGQVTLSGPVRTDAEKNSVEAKAIQVAGAGHVRNDIQIAPKSSK